MSTTDRALRALREMARQLPDTLRLEANRLLDDAPALTARPCAASGSPGRLSTTPAGPKPFARPTSPSPARRAPIRT